MISQCTRQQFPCCWHSFKHFSWFVSSPAFSAQPINSLSDCSVCCFNFLYIMLSVQFSHNVCVSYGALFICSPLTKINYGSLKTWYWLNDLHRVTETHFPPLRVNATLWTYAKKKGFFTVSLPMKLVKMVSRLNKSWSKWPILITLKTRSSGAVMALYVGI